MTRIAYNINIQVNPENKTRHINMDTLLYFMNKIKIVRFLNQNKRANNERNQ